MMREKKVKATTIERYIEFLNMVKENSLPKESFVSLSWMADKGHVAKSATKTLSDLGIIQKEGKYWHWLKGQPSKAMVLEILNFNLNKTKKTVHFPLPGLDAIGDSLKEISERLMQITVQHERALKTTKNTNGETQATNPTIFTEQQQRFEMVKAIAACGIFNSAGSHKERILDIIKIADDIIDLLNKPKP